MEENKPTYIEKVEIKGLWGRFDVNWDLNSDVNILVGENGTGKSTILRVIHKNLEANFEYFNHSPNFTELANLLDKKLYSEVKIDINNDENLGSKYINDSKFGLNNFHSTPSELAVKIDCVNTFDEDLLDSNAINKLDTRVKTSLDLSLYHLQNKYSDYQVKKLMNTLDRGETLEKGLKNLLFFLEIINRLFEPTKKKILREEKSGIDFTLENNKKITPYQLSSGEKQLLIILLTVLVQDEQPSILIMDEPEISLHIRWQHQLIEIIRTLNPNCQLIIATHSPSMFNDGHREKVFWMEDIVSPSKKEEV